MIAERASEPLTHFSGFICCNGDDHRTGERVGEGAEPEDQFLVQELAGVKTKNGNNKGNGQKGMAHAKHLASTATSVASHLSEHGRAT